MAENQVGGAGHGEVKAESSNKSFVLRTGEIRSNYP